MSDKAVYLEDVSASASKQSTSSAASDQSAATTKTVVAKRERMKRRRWHLYRHFSRISGQRTLGEMFNSGPAAKKAKVADPSAATKPKPSPVKVEAPLNSIPFSLSGYKEDLSEEERRLLALECDTMGKSWLKVLKDEIRKPYFLALKVGPPNHCPVIRPHELMHPRVPRATALPVATRRDWRWRHAEARCVPFACVPLWGPRHIGAIVDNAHMAE